MRMKASVRVIVLVLLTALLVPLAGCGARQSSGSAAYAPEVGRTSGSPAPAPEMADKALVAPEGGEIAQDAQSYAAPAAPARSPERLVIRNANLRLEVKKVTGGVDAVRDLAKKYEGVVSQLYLSTEDGGGPPVPLAEQGRIVQSGLPFNASITVLVPTAKFDRFRADAAKLGKVLSENSADDDVTFQHADLKARLENAKAEEQRLRGFFEQAKDVDDMLAIEKELARVRGDIEAMTAQITTMERQVAMATLTIELVEPAKIIQPESGIDWGFREAVRTGIQAMVDVLKTGIFLVLATAPLWLTALAAVLLIRWRIRVKRARAAATAEAAAGPES